MEYLRKRNSLTTCIVWQFIYFEAALKLIENAKKISLINESQGVCNCLLGIALENQHVTYTRF